VTHDPDLGLRAGRRITMVDGAVATDSGAVQQAPTGS
jgi:predicted ABC-type transport system involved in lysophospholipase L1 biosynthesis ATPase subunit